MIIIIENLENGVSRWLLAEYREVIKISKREGVAVIFSNIKDPILGALLGKDGIEVIQEEGWRKFDLSHAIVLDPQAKKTLEPWEVKNACCVIIGGIMGDHPPRGRTSLISSYYINASKRNIGPYQFSVDGSVKVVLAMLKGLRLSDISTIGPPIRLYLKGPRDSEIEIELPYVYPTRSDGSPDIPEEIVELLEHGLMWDEVENLY